jgi:hypothetical protein
MPIAEMRNFVAVAAHRRFPCTPRWAGFSQCTAEMDGIPGTMEAITDSAGRVVRVRFTPDTSADLYLGADMAFDSEVDAMARRWNAVWGRRPARWPVGRAPGEARWATRTGRWRLTLQYDGTHRAPSR